MAAADLAPLQLPLAVQELAFRALQLKVEVPLKPTEVGEADRVRLGPTFTVTLLAILPPAPEQVKLYVVAEVKPEIAWLRLLPVDLAPLQPPEAVQEVALVVLQTSVVLPPYPTGFGLADKVSVGAEAGGLQVNTAPVTWALQPLPLQA